MRFRQYIECRLLDPHKQGWYERFAGDDSAALDCVADERFLFQSQPAPVNAGFAPNPWVIVLLQDQRAILMERLIGPMGGEIGQSEATVLIRLAQDDPKMVRLVVAEESDSRRRHFARAARRL